VPLLIIVDVGSVRARERALHGGLGAVEEWRVLRVLRRRVHVLRRRQLAVLRLEMWRRRPLVHRLVTGSRRRRRPCDCQHLALEGPHIRPRPLELHPQSLPLLQLLRRRPLHRAHIAPPPGRRRGRGRAAPGAGLRRLREALPTPPRRRGRHRAALHGADAAPGRPAVRIGGGGALAHAVAVAASGGRRAGAGLRGASAALPAVAAGVGASAAGAVARGSRAGRRRGRRASGA
jgi:hypothetical protein